MTTKLELQQLIVAYNSILGEPYLDENNVQHPPKVTEMDNVTLLRNCHPSFRGDYAHRLFQEKSITADEAKEFTTVVTKR